MSIKFDYKTTKRIADSDINYQKIKIILPYDYKTYRKPILKNGSFSIYLLVGL